MEKDIKNKIANMSPEELEKFMMERELEHTASISDFIKYLKDNFNENDKICYIDCIEGAKYDATPLLKSDLGKKFFKRVVELKKELTSDGLTSKESADSYYQYVRDNDILVI